MGRQRVFHCSFILADLDKTSIFTPDQVPPQVPFPAKDASESPEDTQAFCSPLSSPAPTPGQQLCPIRWSPCCPQNSLTPMPTTNSGASALFWAVTEASVLCLPASSPNWLQ